MSHSIDSRQTTAVCLLSVLCCVKIVSYGIIFVEGTEKPKVVSMFPSTDVIGVSNFSVCKIKVRVRV